VRTKNTALACAAAFQAIYYAEGEKGAAIDSVALPGLGSGTGKTPPFVCAELMLIGYKLFQRKRYESFDEMLKHLNEELYGIGQGAAAEVGPQPGTGMVAQTIAGGIEKAVVPGWYPPVDAQGDPVPPEAEVAEELAAASTPDDPDDYISNMPIGTSLI
jgi:hypothetical protein